MKVFHWIPQGALARHVDRIWGWEGAPVQPVALPILMPGTGAEVFFHYRAPFRAAMGAAPARLLPQAHLVCARRGLMHLAAQRDIGFVAVRFRAGSLHRFFRLPPAELHDSTLSARELWGAEGAQLAEEVAEEVAGAAAIGARLRLLTRFLCARLAAARPDVLAEEAVRLTYERCADVKLSALAAELGVGPRQLQRRVQATTGQTLVQIRRASRFQKAMRALLLDPQTTLLGPILEQGFFDQAHFAHCCDELGLPAPARLRVRQRGLTHFYNPSARAAATMPTP
jgi:methylphosphotriester-DNA--protein-cysteine methyltransferase